MASDVFYVWAFLGFFVILATVAPLMNAEFGTALETDNDGNVVDEEEATSSSKLTVITIILNLFAIPFWTFGLPVWFNLSILLIIRLVFIFVIARNAWIGGGS